MAKVKISELQGAALDWASVKAAGALHEHLASMSDEQARDYITAITEGDTVDIPDELVEDRG